MESIALEVSVDGTIPTRWYKECVSLFEVDALTLRYFIGEEDAALIRTHRPVLVSIKVLLRRGNQPENLQQHGRAKIK